MPSQTSRQPSPRVLFRQQMAQVFTESELRTLCFDLDIDFEELGQGNKTDRIISLIRLMQRQGRLANLRAAVVDARPHLTWPTPESLESSKDEEWHGTEPTPRKLTREEQLAQRNRQTMLLKVKAYWIDGVLANSLHSKVIPLDMERKPDSVTQPRPWDMLWQHRDQQPQPLPPGTRIIDRFNYAAGDALLILGEPGSGKTTMLLELAGELLEGAEQNEALRIPVVFNLSSWAVKRPPLTEWLVSELQTLYLIPKKVAQGWVEQDDILPLLDGLDEMAQEYRAACIKAINAYREAQGTPLVVCSRIVDYEAIGEKLLLSDGLLLRPLTQEQINEYLVAGRAALEGVRLALRQDETLREMAQSPLLLSIMALAYRDLPPEQVTTTNPDDRRRQLFCTYLQRQLIQRRRDQIEDTATTMRQLAYLARQMTFHNQTLFLIELLQPTWLSIFEQRLLYERTVFLGQWQLLSLFLFCGLILGLDAGLIAGVVLSIEMIGVLLVRKIIGSSTVRRQDIDKSIEKANLSRKQISIKDVTVGLIGSLSVGTGVGLGFGLGGVLAGGGGISLFSLFTPIFGGLIGGLVVVFVFMLIVGRVGIKLLGTAIWSWKQITTRKDVVLGFIGGGSAGICAVIFSELVSQLADAFVFLLVGGLIVGLVGGQVTLLVSMLVETEVTPNEVIKNATQNTPRVWLAFGLGAGLIYLLVGGLIVGLVDGLFAGVVSGLVGGLFIGVVAGLVSRLSAVSTATLGGKRLAKQLVRRLFRRVYGGEEPALLVRFFLHRYGHLPWKLIPFLDMAAERLILQKVGGGYRFVHRLLQEYLASLHEGEGK